MGIPNRQSLWAERMCETYYYLIKQHKADIDWAEHSMVALLFILQRALFDSLGICSLKEELGAWTVYLHNKVSKTTRSVHHSFTDCLVCFCYISIRQSLAGNNTYKQKLGLFHNHRKRSNFKSEHWDRAQIWNSKWKRLLTWINSCLGKFETFSSPVHEIKALGLRKINWVSSSHCSAFAWVPGPVSWCKRL